MAKIGEIIEGKYEVLKQIGKGGMSKVYLAMDQNLNKQWAIKEIEKCTEDKNSRVFIQSAVAEANMMKKLDHPALPRIVDIIEHERVIYVVMDYIEGETLSSLLKKEGEMPQDKVIQWAKELCSVLVYLHSQNPPIIYRDMKPSNIIIHPNGTVKLIDFGIAREYKEENQEDTTSLGTKGYAAPEQFGGRGQTDARTDIYCLGVTLYHLVTGRNPCEPPYEICPIRHWKPELSSGLEYIIGKCTQLNPIDRYQNCDELLQDLERYNKLEEGYRKKQKKKLRFFVGAAGITLTCLLIGVLFWRMYIYTNENDYENNLLLAVKAVTQEEKVAYYTKAISIKPEEIEAYIGLIDTMKEDVSFSLSEEQVLRQYVNGNLMTLQEQEDYAQLAFSIGKLYWYYYEYGKTEDTDNQVTRMKSAVQWFEDACVYGKEEDSFYLMARTYRDIGLFNRDVTLNVQEAVDKGMYAPFWENIGQLIILLEESPEENEIVNLEVYKLATNAMETYARKFKADGVVWESVEQVLQKVTQGLAEVATTTEKTELMKQEILARLVATKEAVYGAYEKNEEVQ